MGENIILIDAEKSFGKIQYSFMKNSQQKKRTEWNFFNVIIYKKPCSKYPANNNNIEYLTPELGNEAKILARLAFIQHSDGGSSHSNKSRKRNKKHPYEKKEIKLSFFIDDMIVHLENPK